MSIYSRIGYYKFISLNYALWLCRGLTYISDDLRHECEQHTNDLSIYHGWGENSSPGHDHEHL